jgi:2-oxoglutarate dehydrogenase E2 component (dihydrolipoamide succinyltransferase)
MTPVVVPKVNSNDVVYTLVEWLTPDGRQVAEGEPLAVVETSKAACELVAERSGILHRAVPVGAECQVGDIIGYLFDSAEERLRFAAAQPHAGHSAVDGHAEVLVTDAAEALARRYGISHGALRQLGQAVVRRADVERLLVDTAEPRSSTVYVASRTQRAVAEVVWRSHTTVPAAFTVTTIYSGALSHVKHAYGAADGVPVGSVEVLVKVIAAMCERFPLFFAVRDEAGEVRLPATANVGVTVDVGNGLYVPVIRKPAGLTLREVGDVLSGFQRAAREGTFRDDELRDANIMLAVHDYTGVDFAMPLIMPGQACALAVGGRRSELYLDPSGAVATRSYFHTCVAYDHRLINGRDAALFARELKLTVETPERLQSVVG